MSTIRTPDQRLRVFVSSTLKELADERQAAQRAISNLRLTPVMFELGARPYPSDQLYQAYLEQSQVFIGIYYQQYGWVAAGREISGIEDEYLLAEKLPKLIYLKSPAPEIEPGLKKMIRGIQQDNTVSYKRFSTPDELQELIENDLALLLTEQFSARGDPAGRQQPGRQAAGRPAEIDHHLPLQPTPFIGRERELNEVIDLLGKEEVRLVTLYGPGGTGKTRLGVRVGEILLQDYPGGVYFVPLAEVSESDLLVSKIAQQLGIREGGSQPLFASLKEYLAGERLLLILDNFEQVVEGANLVAELMAAAPRVKILVTSRTLLNLRGEYEYPVPPLTTPGVDQLLDAALVQQSEAVQLFAARAAAASPGFQIQEADLPLIAKICRRLDGLPLAIELAAARIKLLTPEMLLERLNARLALLTGGARDLPERQQTLRNTLDWSYSLLDEQTRRLFSILSVFAGGFTLEAAQAVCDPRLVNCDLDVLEGLETLLDNSLLRQQASKTGEVRFSMLETIREYALERLAASGDQAAVLDQHAQFFSNKISEISLLNQTSESGYSLDWIEIEHDNLRATLSWALDQAGDLGTGVLILASLGWFWFRRGYLSEGREWSRRMLERMAPGDRSPERVLVLFSNGSLAMWQGDLHEAMTAIDEALEIARWLEFPFHLAVVLLFKGTIYVNMGQDREAQAYLAEAESLFEQLGMSWYQTVTRVHIANAALGQGETARALEVLTRAAASSDEIREKWLHSLILNNLGEVSRVTGEYEQAQSYYLQSEALLREMNDTGDLARLVQNLGYTALHQGDYDRAAAQFSESLAMFLKLNNPRGIAESLSAVAGLWVARGRYEEGAKLFGAAQELLNQSGGSWWPADRVEIEHIAAELEKKLAGEVLEASLAAGKQMTMQAAVSMAQRGAAPAL